MGTATRVVPSAYTNSEPTAIGGASASGADVAVGTGAVSVTGIDVGGAEHAPSTTAITART